MNLRRIAARAIVFRLVVFARQLIVNRMEEAAACARILVVEGGGALHRHPALVRAVLVVVQGLRHVLYCLKPLVKYGVRSPKFI